MYPKAKRQTCRTCNKSLPMGAFTTYFRSRQQCYITETKCRKCKYGYIRPNDMWLDDHDLGEEWQEKKENAYKKMIERGIFKD
jgi:RNase P subunit RPR2